VQVVADAAPTRILLRLRTLGDAGNEPFLLVDVALHKSAWQPTTGEPWVVEWTLVCAESTFVVGGVESQVVAVEVEEGVVEPHSLHRLRQVVEHHTYTASYAAKEKIMQRLSK
jgi:hypothetical protein